MAFTSHNPVSLEGNSGASSSNHTPESSIPSFLRPSLKCLHEIESSTSANMPAPTSIDQEVPSSLFFSYPLCHGSAPVGRWSHTCVAVGSKLLMYGGVGRAVLDDLCVLDVETMCWSQVSVSAATAKDRPEKILGHAAAAVGNRMWMFGGQEGRSFLRKLYSVDTENWAWKRHTTDSLPSARAGHAMASVNGQIYLFAGQGKKMYNDLHVLEPETGKFREVNVQGTPPAPRKGMSFVYDGRDSIVCFGGSKSSGMDNQMSVFSISKQEWFTPLHHGPVPSARTNHTAVLLCPRQMLFFGGCNAQGGFLSDAYVLDTSTWTWHRPQQLNTPPAPRYYHSCTAVGGKVFLYGGINAKQRFDGVVVLESKFNTEISHIAQELHQLMAVDQDSSVSTDGLSSRAESSNGAHVLTEVLSKKPGTSVDLMKLQLTDLLMKRNMEEMHAQAARKAEDTLCELSRERSAREALAKELLQAKLMAAEADEAAMLWKGKLHDIESKASKDSTMISELRSQNERTIATLESTRQELAHVKRLNDGLVKELGVTSSRHAQLQGYCMGLEQRSKGIRGEASSPQVERSAPEPSASEPVAEEAVRRSAQPAEEMQMMSATSTPRQAVESAATSASDPYDSSCLLLERLSESENQRAALLEDLQKLREEFQMVQDRSTASASMLEQLQAKPEALAVLSRGKLQNLELQMEGTLRSVRDIIMQRKISEAQQQVSVEHNMCSVCLENTRSVVFGCGHQSCESCSTRMTNCPFCRVAINARIKLFDA